MAIKFYKLMDLLNREGISKGDLQKEIGASSATIAKLSNNEYVAMVVIDKTLNYLTRKLGRPISLEDVMEFMPDQVEGNQED